MSASTSAPKTTITQSIGGWAGGVPISRLARASCETRRNNSLTGSGDPPPFAMPQIIAPTPTVRNSLRWLGRRQHGAERAQWSDVATGGGRQAEGLQTARGLGPLLPRHAALSRARTPADRRAASSGALRFRSPVLRSLGLGPGLFQLRREIRHPHARCSSVQSLSAHGPCPASRARICAICRPTSLLTIGCSSARGSERRRR